MIRKPGGSYNPPNKSTLDKFSEVGGVPYFNGSPLNSNGGGIVSDGSKITDGTIPSSKLKTATDADKIKLVHLSTEVTQAMNGTGALPDAGISALKTDAFLRDSINLINPNTIKNDYSYNPVTGVLSASSGSSVTDYIPVTALATYTTSIAYLTWTWFDSSKNFLSGHYAGAGLNTGTGPAAGKQNDAPAGAAFIRLGGSTANVAGSMFIQGKSTDAPSDFIPYNRYGFTNLVYGEKLGHFAGKKMIVFGDSIAMDGDGSTSPKRADRWTGYFERDFGFKVTNYAIGGSRMTPQAGEPFKSVYNVIMDGTVKVDTTAEYCVIAIGTNDHSKNMPLGTLADTTSSTFYGAYRLSIEALLTANPTMKIFICTPIQKFMGVTDPGSGLGYFINGANANGVTLLDFCQAIKNLGDEYSIPVIDMYRNSRINKMNYSQYMLSDKLHPNVAGHRVMAEAMKKAMF